MWDKAQAGWRSMTATDKHRKDPAPITRSLVLGRVQDLDQDEDIELNISSDIPRKSQSAHSYDEEHRANDSLTTGASLGEIRDWLDLQCEKEQARIDWDPEYEPHLDRCSGNGQRTGPDTAVLDRIRRGHGPRSAKFEDLLWPLRINSFETDTRYRKRPINESYRAMQEVLQKWNEHVASPHDDPEAREALVDAMYSRISFLDRTLSHRRSADAHDDTSRKLLHAIHTYRPETASFETKDTCHLLTIILAHIGFANPDIDQELKFLIFYTLVTERNSMAHTANADARLKLEDKIATAKRHGDVTALTKYARKMSDWTRDIAHNNCATLCARIKTARLNIPPIILANLQPLTIQQTAQKILLDETLRRGDIPSSSLVPQASWLPAHLSSLSTATHALAQRAHMQIDKLLTSTLFAAQSIAAIKVITSSRVLTRAYKFSGRDLHHVSDAERRRVVAERMAHPATVGMMGDAVEGITEARAKAREILGVLEDMRGRLEEMVGGVDGMIR
ncbi:hypothetical protein BDU57DRAFT_519688 [Ampelomyces quisqualis]|uniref:Uncharacterized protein n=1 Tax=Ampelomyces quisqualis TaxID=50730 RepID=A0A6A5QGW0_AMPQU|nr:hypothetical protein BDU57DRAFT_519688 [Ampelomyces quisqualis]